MSAGIAAFVLRQRKHKRAAFCELQDACGGFPVFLHATRSFGIYYEAKIRVPLKKAREKTEFFSSGEVEEGGDCWESSVKKPRVILF